jgi:hypothetical protein
MIVKRPAGDIPSRTVKKDDATLRRELDDANAWLAAVTLYNARLKGVLRRLAEPMSGFCTEHAREIIRAALAACREKLDSAEKEVKRGRP